MGKEFKPVGRAVASAKGHYPMADGRMMTIKPGEIFEVFDGMTESRWFEVLTPGSPDPKPAKPAVAATEPDTFDAVAGIERKRRYQTKAPMLASDS